MRERIIIAGFGGQGVLFLGKLLAQAMMHEGKHVTYFPSYGPEVRGGRANCHVIISPDEIFSPIITEADTVFAMSQPAWDFFATHLRPDGLAILNTSIVDPGGRHDPGRSVAVPATEVANELGDVRVANMAMLGAYNARRTLLSPDALLEHLAAALGERKATLFELNRQAIHKGMEAAAG